VTGLVNTLMNIWVLQNAEHLSTAFTGSNVLHAVKCSNGCSERVIPTKYVCVRKEKNWKYWDFRLFYNCDQHLIRT
jgi:hypothetical protein